MFKTPPLVYPRLERGLCASLTLETDERLSVQTSVRIAFTTRHGGVSEPPYASLNLGSHVKDVPESVAENRSRLCAALQAPAERLAVPNQVHKDCITVFAGQELGESQLHAVVEELTLELVAAGTDPDSIPAFNWQVAFTEHEFHEQAQSGSDALITTQPNLPLLLCFADCMPVIIVSPAGSVAVIHAGWRGVVARIAPQALLTLCALDRARGFITHPADCNIYIGPHIHGCCFEVGEEVARTFKDLFGEDVLAGTRHVDMQKAQIKSLVALGADTQRIVASPYCTQCQVEDYFSYRAENGTCGRHGAFACIQQN